MQSRKPEVSGAAVEVSGWGPGAAFFMESAVLEDKGSQRKRVALYHPVRAGAVVFVRPTGLLSANLFPVAYQAEKVGSPSQEGRREVVLVKLAEQRYS